MNMNAIVPAAAMPVLQEDGLKRYLQEIRRFPILKPEEELALARRFHQHGDLDAAHRLVTSHLRLVSKIAYGFRNYGLPMSDLISEGNIGLMKAVKKFEPERGFKLATYAMWWIKASITEYVLQSWSLVKLSTSAAHKKLFFNLRRLKSGLDLVEGQHLTHEQVGAIARKLGVSAGEVTTMEYRLAARDSSLNAPVRMDSELERQDLLVDETPDPEALLAGQQESKQGLHMLKKGMEVLNPRERRIIAERRLKDEPATLEELASLFGISRERVRQIEVKAFAKLQKHVLAQSHEPGLLALPAARPRAFA
jgi:RNA polymerase sigma-32 factor